MSEHKKSFTIRYTAVTVASSMLVSHMVSTQYYDRSKTQYRLKQKNCFEKILAKIKIN